MDALTQLKEVYSLIAESCNNGDYEDYWTSTEMHGVFSSVDKAKEYAEKVFNRIKNSDSGKKQFKILDEWTVGDDGRIWKAIVHGTGYMDEWTETYYIEKICVDPEFKEE